MAAMGAQAASQIEGNRMMQETVQRGMKGVEDFAARRQLAAARAQLGELNINDPDYGQKLSGLVMDNPLAFTNEKTAGVANFAFKQAANDFQSKRESEQRTALQAAEFNLRRDLANMDTQSRMSLASTASNTDIQAKIYSERFAALDQQRASVLRQMEATNSPVARALLNKQLQGINASSEELSRGFESKASGSDFDTFSSYSGYEPAPLPEDSTQVPTTTGSAGNGPELPTAGEGTMSALDIIPPGIQDGGSFGAPSRIQEVPAAPFTAEDGLPPVPVEGGIPVPPVPAPVVSAAAPVSATTTAAPVPTRTPAYGLTLEDQQLLDTIIAEENLAKAKKTDEGMSASAYKEEEGLRQNIVGANPRIAKLRAEVETLKSRENLAIKAMEKDTLGFSPEKIAAVNKLSDDRIAKESELKGAENVIEARLRIEGNKPYLKRLDEEDQKQVKEKEKAEAVLIAAAFAGAPAAGAGTAVETPKKPVELNFFEQALLEEAPAKRKELEESSNQWAGAKQSIRGALGTGENGLEKIALEVFKADVLGKGLPFVKAQLIERIANEVKGRIPQGTKNAPIKFGLTDTAFSQKSYRLGFNAVTWYEVVGAMADDLISQYEKAQIGANAPTTNTSLENKNPSLGAVSAIPVP
jgi:hypothetical protein